MSHTPLSCHSYHLLKQPRRHTTVCVALILLMLAAFTGCSSGAGTTSGSSDTTGDGSSDTTGDGSSDTTPGGGSSDTTTGGGCTKSICKGQLIQECDTATGKLERTRSCDPGHLCQIGADGAAACAPRCKNDRCAGTQIQKCTKGLYEKPAACPTDEVCSPESPEKGKCIPKCTPKNECTSDDTLQYCDSDGLLQVETCKEGEKCQPLANNNEKHFCAKPCPDGKNLCAEGILTECKNGYYQPPIECPNNSSCIKDWEDNPICSSCKEDYCDGSNYVVKCVNGIQQRTKCESDTTCRQSYNNPGQFHCASDCRLDKCEYGVLTECKGIQWGYGYTEPPVKCPEHKRCVVEEDGTEACGTCRNFCYYPNMLSTCDQNGIQDVRKCEKWDCGFNKFKLRYECLEPCLAREKGIIRSVYTDKKSNIYVRRLLGNDHHRGKPYNETYWFNKGWKICDDSYHWHYQDADAPILTETRSTDHNEWFETITKSGCSGILARNDPNNEDNCLFCDINTSWPKEGIHPLVSVPCDFKKKKNKKPICKWDNDHYACVERM